MISVLVRELAPLERFLPEGAQDERAQAAVHRLAPAGEGVAQEEIAAQEVGSSMRAAAPPVQSFAMGRRR